MIKASNRKKKRVTVVSWNFNHGRRHCVSEEVQLLQREGLLERLISNTYDVYDSNLEKMELSFFSKRLPYLLLRIKNVLFKKYKNVQFREWLFDSFARSNLGKPDLIYLDAERFPEVIRYAKKNKIKTVLYQRTAHVNYSISVLENERDKRNYKTGYLNDALNTRRLKCINNVDFILAHSQFVKDTDIANGFNEKNVRVVYGCVDTEIYKPLDLKQKQNMIILFVGHDPVLKGVFYLLDAWRLIQKKVDNAELWIVGSNHAPISDLYRELKNVKYIGYQPEMVKIYQKSSLLVQPSLVDAGPKAVTEGMACGLPVVVSNAIGYSEIIEDGVNGYVIPARNHIELAKKLEYCIAHPLALKKMGDNARIRVKMLSHEDHAGKVVDAIKSVVTSGTFGS